MSWLSGSPGFDIRERSVNDESSLDHREINQDLPVFATDPLAGAGLPLTAPGSGS